MRIHGRVGWMATGVALVGAASLFSGCCRKPEAPPPPPDTPFQRVMSHLDSGGDLLVVANLDGWVEQFVGSIQQDLALSATNNANWRAVSETVARVNTFLQKNGFYAVRGYGLSVVPLTNGVNGVKSFVARDPAAASLPLWQGLVGGEARRLAALDFLPADTALVRAGAADLNQLWQMIGSGVADIAPPAAATAFRQAVAGVQMGVDLDRLFQSLGDESFFSIQLARETTVSLPLGSKSVTVPEPAFLLAAAVKDDTIVSLLDAQLAKTGMPLSKKQIGDATVRSLPIPLPLPVALQPSYTQHGGYFLFGSNGKVVADALTAAQQKNGLLATPEFQQAFAGLPMTNNGIVYVSPRFAQFVGELQQAALAGAESKAAAAGPDQEAIQAMLRGMTRWNGMGACAFAIVNMEQGVLMQGNSTTGGKALVAGAFAAPLGLMAAIAIPSFMRARTTSQQNACINNLRQIEAAKDSYALENGRTNQWCWASDEQAFQDLVSPGTGYIKAFPLCPASTTDTQNVAQSAADYQVNPIGSEAVCRHHPDQHTLSPAAHSRSHLRRKTLSR